MNPERPQNSAGALLGSVISHLTTLVRKEILLARAEVGEQVNRAAGALGLMALAGIFLTSALTVLAGAIVVALSAAGLTPGWAAALVGGLFFVVAAALMVRGRTMLRGVTLVPTRTATALSDDFDILKENLNDR